MTYALLALQDHATKSKVFADLSVKHMTVPHFNCTMLKWRESRWPRLLFFLSHQFFNLFEFSPFSSLRIYLCSITFQTLLLFKEPIFQLPEPHIFLAANLSISQNNFYSWICQINFTICTVHILEKPTYQETFSFT